MQKVTNDGNNNFRKRPCEIEDGTHMFEHEGMVKLAHGNYSLIRKPDRVRYILYRAWNAKDCVDYYDNTSLLISNFA